MSLHVHCDDPAARAWLTALLNLPETGIDTTPYALQREATRYVLKSTDIPPVTLARGTLGEVMEVTARLVGEQTVGAYHAGLALHAACVTRGGRGILIPGASGAGKTTLTAWLLHRGYDYVTDELTLVPRNTLAVAGWSRPLHVKSDALPLVSTWARACEPLCYPHGAFIPAQAFGPRAVSPTPAVVLSTVLFVRFDSQASLSVQPLTAAQAARRLWDVTANTARLPERGFFQVTALARRLRAWALTYADVSALDAWLAQLD